MPAERPPRPAATAPVHTAPLTATADLASELDRLVAEARRLSTSPEPQRSKLGRIVLELCGAALRSARNREERAARGPIPPKPPRLPSTGSRASRAAVREPRPVGRRGGDAFRNVPVGGPRWILRLTKCVRSMQRPRPVPATAHDRREWARSFDTVLHAAMPGVGDTQAALLGYFAAAEVDGCPPQDVLRGALTAAGLDAKVIDAALAAPA